MKAGPAGWAGMALTLGGVGIQSLLPLEIRFSFLVFFAGNVLWFCNGLLTRNWPLVAMQIVCGALNIFAIAHWFSI